MNNKNIVGVSGGLIIDGRKNFEKLWDELEKYICEHEYKFSNNDFEIFGREQYNFFKEIDLKVGEVCLEYKTYFRAREDRNKEKFNITKQLEPPPIENCHEGRLNKENQRYFYMAEDEKTAISEIRPWIGAHVYVGQCKPVNERKIILKDFTINDYDRMDDMKKAYKEFVSEHFSKPVSSYDSKKEYVITQVISEYIKSYSIRKDAVKGYDGIKYTSSANKGGVNIVIFNPESIKVEKISKELKIEEINVSYS